MGVFDPLRVFRPTIANAFNASGVLTSHPVNSPRTDYDPTTLAKIGYLIEQSRTNSNRNSTMLGAVAGTPGVAPINWSMTTTVSGITREIISIGIVDGIEYIRVRWYGTAIGIVSIVAYNETPQFVVATPYQVWTASFFARLHAGAWPVGTVNITLRYGTAAGAGIAFLNKSMKTVNGDDLRKQRQFFSAVAPALTERVVGGFQTTVANGETIDFTIDIGLPQLEQGVFPTSPIKTSTVAVTRGGDNVVLGNSAGWLDPTEGTLITKWTLPNVWRNGMPTAFYAGVIIRTVDNLNRITHYVNDLSTARVSNLQVVVSDVPSWTPPEDVVTPVTLIVSRATAFRNNDFASAFRGGALKTATVPVPPGLTELLLTGFLHLREVRYYPKRLTNAKIQTESLP